MAKRQDLKYIQTLEYLLQFESVQKKFEEEFSFDKRKNISYNDFRNFVNSIFRK